MWTLLAVKLREVLITLLFLRPAVDAYRISTNHEDGDHKMDSLAEMIMNKCAELACESIPGCVLQLYVWLTNPEQAGSYALVSIGISALTTGFNSVMIALLAGAPNRCSTATFRMTTGSGDGVSF